MPSVFRDTIQDQKETINHVNEKILNRAIKQSEWQNIDEVVGRRKTWNSLSNIGKNIFCSISVSRL
jgi:hypothetical protein